MRNRPATEARHLAGDSQRPQTEPGQGARLHHQPADSISQQAAGETADYTHKKAQKMEKDAKKTKDRECTAEHYPGDSEDSHHCRARTLKKHRTRSAAAADHLRHVARVSQQPTAAPAAHLDEAPFQPCYYEANQYTQKEETTEPNAKPQPTPAPTPTPTDAPTQAPTPAPTPTPTDAPTEAPTPAPTPTPTAPTEAPYSEYGEGADQRETY